MKFEPGFNIIPTYDPIGFSFGEDCFGPIVENRRLDDIRKSLSDPQCTGPEIVYSIAMDVGKKVHREMLKKKHLLFGAVIYAAGRLGKEPVRSQGHIHKNSPLTGWSTPEVYEIWDGKAIIYMQETAKDDPGRCYAVYAQPGEVVIVPPGWAHATISAQPEKPLVFGAWCDRAYGFEYEEVRRHQGLAWIPILEADNIINWIPNKNYRYRDLVCKKPNAYPELGIHKGIPIYTLFEQHPETFSYVPDPALKATIWSNFEP